jgi:hypothetical protein
VKITLESLSAIALLQADLSSESVSIEFELSGIKSKQVIDLSEKDKLLINLFDEYEKILYGFYLLSERFNVRFQDISFQLENNSEDDFNIIIMIINDFETKNAENCSKDVEGTNHILINKVFSLSDYYLLKSHFTKNLKDLNLNIKEDFNYKKLFLKFLEDADDSQDIVFSTFINYLLNQSSTIPEFNVLDEFILTHRVDVLNFCLNPDFDKNTYINWVKNHGIFEYKIEKLIEVDTLLSGYFTRNQKNFIINSMNYTNNGLSYLKKSIENYISILDPFRTNYKTTICLGGAFEFQSIYPHTIFFDTSRIKIAIWVWELNSVPPELVLNLKKFDEIWTLSEHSQRALQAHKITSRVVRFPVTQSEDVRNLLVDGNTYFLTLFDFNSDFERKNPVSVIEAFQLAFSRDEEVNLIVKCTNSRSDLKNYLKLKEISKNDKRIVLFNKTLENIELTKLISNSIAVISLHRAEGLGLNIIDSILNNKIIILSKYSSPTEYLPDSYEFFVNGEEVDIDKFESVYRYAKAKWFNPSVLETSKLMSELYLNKNKNNGNEKLKKHLREFFVDSDKNSLKSNLIRVSKIKVGNS